MIKQQTMPVVIKPESVSPNKQDMPPSSHEPQIKDLGEIALAHPAPIVEPENTTDNNATKEEHNKLGIEPSTRVNQLIQLCKTRVYFGKTNPHRINSSTHRLLKLSNFSGRHLWMAKRAYYKKGLLLKEAISRCMEAADSVKHWLTECPATLESRTRLFGRHDVGLKALTEHPEKCVALAKQFGVTSC